MARRSPLTTLARWRRPRARTRPRAPPTSPPPPSSPPARRPRAASGWRWPAARRSRAWRSGAARARATAPASRPRWRRWRSWGPRGSACRSPRRSARRCSGRWRRAACGRGSRSSPAPAVRVLTNAIGAAFFIWVIAGGLDAYAGTLRQRGRAVRLHARRGRHAGAHRRRAARLGGVRELGAGGRLPARAWRAGRAEAPPRPSRREPVEPSGPRPLRPAGRRAGRGDRLRAAARRAPSGCCSARWPRGWRSRGRASPARQLGRCPPASRSAAMLAGGALLFTLGGGLGLDEALRRALAGVAAGGRGHLAARGRGRSRAARGRRAARSGACRGSPRCPRPRARSTGSARRAGWRPRAGRCSDALATCRGSPLPILDAVLGWVADRSARFAPSAPAPPLALRLRALDAGCWSPRRCRRVAAPL